MTDTLLSKQRNKILVKFADHILKESCPHCQNIVRDALIAKEDEIHCKKCGEWLEGFTEVCIKCRMVLSYDAYAEAIDESEVQKSRLDRVEEKMKGLEAKYKK